ncbi:MAG: integrase, partial [Pseudomonadota bacterium]|nr:integrase [Pseudomonadota bacterium]
ARSYYARWGRSGIQVIGKVGEFTPDEARERCQKILGNVAHGRPPLEGLDGADGLTLGQFVTDTYTPWVKAHRPRTAEGTLWRLGLHFAKWYNKPLSAITVEDVEGWRLKRINEGIEPSTVRRDLDALSSVLTRAVKLDKLAINPVHRIERPKIDRTPKVRYLDTPEEKRLRKALSERDAEMRKARESANRWRKARKQDPLPPLPYFGDHLTPAVLISMNTGMRRGELLALRWANVDMKGKQLTVEGATAKAGQTRHIPLNDEALDVLKKWKEQAPAGERVIAVDTGFKTAWASLLERAKITAFRWHDLRHHFASRLVQAGVPLNTVRELLGHGSMAMTLRYAHLAPDQKAAAVAKLVAKP